MTNADDELFDSVAKAISILATFPGASDTFVPFAAMLDKARVASNVKVAKQMALELLEIASGFPPATREAVKSNLEVWTLSLEKLADRILAGGSIRSSDEFRRLTSNLEQFVESGMSDAAVSKINSALREFEGQKANKSGRYGSHSDD
jgi:hypothetical protein